MQASEFNQYFDHFPFLKKHFVGIFAIDTLPKSLKFRKFCICNTDVSSGSGKHWFSLLRNSKTSVECFDSLGINAEKKLLLEKYCNFTGISELIYNETQFQDDESTTCGLFVLYFIFERMHNLDMSFHELLQEIFESENTLLNEEKVTQFCSSLNS